MIKLYGSKFSLFTGKARSYLIKKGIPYEEVTSTLGVYKKFIIPRTGVRYVPVIQTDDDVVIQDTTEIIDYLEEQNPENSIYPSSPKQKLVSMLLEVYGDEWLVIPAMHYRWNFPEQNNSFIYAEFGSLVLPKAPKFIQRFLGKKVGGRFKGFVPRLGITEQTIPALEASYEQLLKDLDEHFSVHNYLLGGRPTIGDFGLMGPLYAHLFRDPAPKALMLRIAPNVCAWVERMNDVNAVTGELLQNDEIPVTLTPILKRMAGEHLPVLIDTARILAEWRESNPNKQEVERFIGMHQFTVEGVSAQRAVLPYALWMLQRPVNFYHSLGSTADVDNYLSTVGFGNFSEIELANPLVRKNNKMLFAD